jgi:dUTP pyrophosphatase
MLRVKLLSDKAKLPTIAHPGEDLGYDLYSAEDVVIPPKGNVDISTGISAEFTFEQEPSIRVGFLVKEKSSYARRRLVILGGVCDAGYRGEFRVLMENLGDEPQEIHCGDKVANLVPMIVLAKSVEETKELNPSLRGDGGFGSTGRS